MVQQESKPLMIKDEKGCFCFDLDSFIGFNYGINRINEEPTCPKGWMVLNGITEHGVVTIGTINGGTDNDFRKIEEAIRELADLYMINKLWSRDILLDKVKSMKHFEASENSDSETIIMNIY